LAQIDAKCGTFVHTVMDVEVSYKSLDFMTS
jgi:hypothetical protein